MGNSVDGRPHRRGRDENEQGDTTIHNLPGLLDASFLGIVVVSLVLIGLIAWRWLPIRAVPLTLVAWLAVPALYAAFRLGAGHVGYETAKLSEAVELCFAVAIARVAWYATRAPAGDAVAPTATRLV